MLGKATQNMIMRFSMSGIPGLNISTGCLEHWQGWRHCSWPYIHFTLKLFPTKAEIGKVETNKSKEILINATHVAGEAEGEAYEFVINDLLAVVECIRVDSLSNGLVTPIKNTAIIKLFVTFCSLI